MAENAAAEAGQRGYWLGAPSEGGIRAGEGCGLAPTPICVFLTCGRRSSIALPGQRPPSVYPWAVHSEVGSFQPISDDGHWLC